ncbi:leucine--tRNA ligase [Haloarchaeobius sp. DT45]|uniref:leucine--tRNA ligase n=1 Tax=Haloarchaeobius sp. DT45 TaxID=3446116 RepID=UPI003F6B2B46
MEYDPQALEATWRDRWREEGRYEATPDPGSDAEPTFVTVPYPYPSGGMHIGHARTYTVPDVYARYRRQQGDNVLFPIAWHVTGTPIVGAVERLKKGEAKQLDVLTNTYNVSEDTLEELETPMGFARHFIEEHYKKGMQQLGLSIDWRREFTTNDERYSKFITWQYETLRERGLLEKGLHPVKYCTEEHQPVTTHDLLEGEEAEFQEYTLVKFGAELDGADVTVPMATLRPETVRGVTNAFVDPDADYVVAEVDDEFWFVSQTAAEKLDLQGHEVEVRYEYSGTDLVGKHVENPVTGDDVLVLPASFVDADNATGVVMSVPAHSPDDYLALQEAREAAAAGEMAGYGIDADEVAAIEPVPILEIEGYGEVPAKSAVEEAGIESSQDPDLKAVTQDLYNAEFHSGKLLAEYGKFAGKVVEDVRDEFKQRYLGDAFATMQEFSEAVVCRCGGDVEVAKQETWFLRYNDADWKEKAHDAVAGLDAIPENTREQYDQTIDWLNEWPCIRNYGLGTRLPWDPEFVIEPLSDSTVYMAYYTFAHRLADVDPDEMDREFFDTLFYGADAVEEPPQTALDLREEWDYWYPVDYRCSGNDLVTNHLTFYLFHHAELFEPSKWPRGITVMGMGLLEGEKMSSSKGHVVLPGEAIETYGADTVRFFLMNSAEPWQDYDWRAEQVASTRDQLDRFWRRARDIIERAEPRSADSRAAEPRDSGDGERNLEQIDRWLLSRLQDTVATVTEAMDRFETRTASQAAFYNFEEDLRWYRRRTDTNRAGATWTLRTVLETRLRLLAPFVPFLANELHEQLTGTPAEDAPWPGVDDSLRSPRDEAAESLVERLTDDINGIQQSLQNAAEDVPEADPDVVRVTVAADWKHDVFETVHEVGPDQGVVMNEVMSDPALREKGNAVNDLVQDLVDLVRGTDDDRLVELASLDEAAVYEDAAGFLAREFDAEVVVETEADDADTGAVPFRPSIDFEAN